jgi:hypothetical protein
VATIPTDRLLISTLQVLLLAVPGREGATGVDPEGHMALAVLRTLGLPEVVVAVQCPGESRGGGSSTVEV